MKAERRKEMRLEVAAIPKDSTMAEAPKSLTGGNVFVTAFNLLKESFRQWLENKAPQLGAALAYYTVFSLAPLILVLLAILGLLFRHDPAGAWQKSDRADEVFSRSERDRCDPEHRAESIAA